MNITQELNQFYIEEKEEDQLEQFNTEEDE